MIYLNDVMEGKVYKHKVFLPRYTGKNKKDIIKSKGSIIFMMTPSNGDATEYIKEERYFSNQNKTYRSYYIDTIYKTKTIGSKIFKNRYNYRAVVSNVKSKYSLIKNIYLDLGSYKGNNLFYDMGLHNQIFRTVSKNSNDTELKSLLNKNIIECTLDDDVTLDSEIFTEAFRTEELTTANTKSYSIQPAILNVRYFEYLKANVFSENFSDYDEKTMIVPLDMWMTKNEVPTSLSGFKPKNSENIVLFLFEWLENGRFKELPEMTIVFTANGCMTKVNSHNIYDNNKLQQLVLRMLKTKDEVGENHLGGTENLIPPDEEQTTSLTINTVKTNIVDAIVNTYNAGKNVVGFTGEDVNVTVNPETGKESGTAVIDEDTSEDVDNAEETINTVEKATDRIVENNPDITPEELLDKINTDKDTIAAITKMKREMLVGRSANSLKRDAKLREEFLQKKIKNGLTVKDVLSTRASAPIETTAIKVNVLNKDLNNMSIQNFDTSYRKTTEIQDLYKVAYAFAKDKDIDVIPKDIKIEDTSNKFNAKKTVTILFEDSNRVRHTFTVDIPILVDDRFLYLNGSRKIMNKQLILLPISKTNVDTVQVVTNYNKIFIVREGKNVSPTLERLKKMLGNYKKKSLFVKVGSNRHLNLEYMRTVEYDELANRFMEIRIKSFSMKLDLNFNIDKCYTMIEKEGLPAIKDENLIPIGIEGGSALYLNIKTGDIIKYTKTKNESTGQNLIEYIYGRFEEEYGPDFTTQFGALNVGKKYIYSRASIMGKKLALGILLAYTEGSITGLLKKLDINYKISPTAPKFDNPIERMNWGILRFADAYLMYDATKYRNVLLLEGLTEAPLRMYNLGDFDVRDTYLDIFENLLGSRSIANAFDNFKLCMIDPITKDILEDLGYPTDYTEVLAFANGLLEDNSYKLESDMSLYRLRSAEIMNAYLYKTLADAYGTYRITSNNKNPVKMTVPKDTIIKSVMTAPNVEEYSILNPVLELDKTRTVSFKGLSGLNLEQAYTLDKRLFNPTMLGILGSSTAYSGAVGITRRLTLDAKVKSVRGYLDLTNIKDVNKLTAKQVFTAAEAINPLVANHDDAQRVLMASTQAGHMVPVENSNKILIGNGTDKIIANVMTDDYTFKAKQNGVIESLDEATNLMILKYKDGTYDMVDIGPKMAKNSSSGFYIDNKLTPIFKKGEKFNAGDVVASNQSYFSEGMVKGQVSYKPGTLAKIAIHSTYFTIEDATGIGQRLSELMATSVVMPKQVVLGPNSNIDYICNVGDSLDVGDPLLIFDESFDSPEINKMLAKMSSDEADEVSDIGKSKVKSKYSATIGDIKIYYTCEYDELSPSLKELIDKYAKGVNKKKGFAKKFIKEKYKIEGNFEPVEKVTPDSRGKVKGVDLENGVMIEFYEKYRDPVGIGDKIIYYTALKGIVSKVIPHELHAFSEYHKDEPIDAFVGPIGIGGRMTTSIDTVCLGNKVLIELKNKCRELAYGK